MRLGRSTIALKSHAVRCYSCDIMTAVMALLLRRPYYYGSTALFWALTAFQFLDLIHRRQDTLDGGSARWKASIYTQNYTNRINAHNTGIYALSGIRTQDSSFRGREVSSCLRPRGQCDRLVGHITYDIKMLTTVLWNPYWMLDNFNYGNSILQFK
jgi:hypothetical protein